MSGSREVRRSDLSAASEIWGMGSAFGGREMSSWGAVSG